MLAHELRNPLAAISNAVDARRPGPTSRSTSTGRWTSSRGRCRHLSRLIDDLLDVSRITRGKIELRREVVDADPDPRQCRGRRSRPLVEERRHTLDVSIDRGDLWVEADPTRLEQVVVNLLNNAAKYSEDGGHIRLSARDEAGEVVIRVRDRGVGIPPEKLPEMFELFAQGDRSLARSEGGLGIGLTVVKKLVEMHGGSVDAPRAKGRARAASSSSACPRAKPPRRRRPRREGRGEARREARILVVDDNVDTASGMARLLKLLGHEVATAHDGPEALEAAQGTRGRSSSCSTSACRAWTATRSPRSSGRRTCCKDAVIIAVSGYGQDEDRRRSKQAGFDHHLVKPLDHDALLALLAGSGKGRG